MSTLSATLFSVSPQSFWNWGRIVLTGGLGFGLLAIVYGLWAAQSLLVLLPVLVIGVVAAFILCRHPLLNLCAVLAGFAFVVTYSEGISVIEVIYGAYALGYLALWFVTRIFFYQEKILDTTEAKALFLFLAAATGSIALSVLYGARPITIVSEWTALLMLGFYFPIKEACKRYRIAPAAFLLILAWIGFYVTVRNGLDYYSGLANVKYLFEILKNRAIMNVDLMLSISLFYLVFLIFAPKWRYRLPLLFGLVAALGILLISQSRAAWACFVLAAILMFLLVDRHHKLRMLTFGLVTAGGTLALGFLFFGDLIILILSGMMERAATLGQGASDFSLRLRYYEAQGAFAHIVTNPVLGHGVGVPFTFFDAESQSTVVRTFIHNGYVSLWYRFGLWGPALILFFWLGSIWRALALFRQTHAPILLRLCGLGAGISLAAFLISANTSNPFYLKDTTFLFAVISGLAAGASGRAKLVAANFRHLS